MRLPRSFGLALGVLAWGACDHEQTSEVITRDGESVIPIISMSTANAGGFLGGSRATNRFLASGTFDTSIVDAFSRSGATPPNFIADPNGFGYGNTPMYYGARVGGSPVNNYFPPTGLLPAVVNMGQYSYGDLYGATYSITYIVPGGHPGNGGSSWEFWYVIRDLIDSQRYIMGLVRYAVEQRGALDWAERLLTGAVTQPDSLVFMAGDFNPGGNKENDNGYIVDCADPAEGRPVDGANPYFVAGKTVATGSASRRIIIDQTICSDASTVWSNGFTSAKSPIPVNNAAPGPNQYNFLVVWEALADSTPDYSRPVWREQVAPVLTTTGELYNNGFAPFPPGGLTPAQLALLPGATASPDTIRVTASNLVPLASGSAYSVWLAVSGSGQAAKVTGRVIRRSGGTVVDTIADASEFNLAPGMTGATVEFDFAPHIGTAWDAVTFAVGAAGASSIPAGQPLWTPMVTEKVPGGPIPVLTSTMTFGAFNGGTSSLVFGAAGSGTGGIYGNLLREDILRLPRPPVGYMYEAWLVNSVGAVNPMSIGPLLSPFPDLQPLTDADVSTSPPLSGVELTQAALRYEGTGTTFFCDWDQVQVRVAAKSAAGGTMPPTIVLNGTNPRTGCP